MNLRLLVALAGAALVVCPAALAARLTPQDASLLARMNTVRAAHGLQPLQPDLRLEDAAAAHSRQILATGDFAHGAFVARIAHFGVTAPAGENLAWGTGSLSSPAAVVDAWLSSPRHRANLLAPGFRLVGVASLSGSFDGHGDARVVTADFAD